MKNLILISLSISFLTSSCGDSFKVKQCPSVSQKNVYFLIDQTDSLLYAGIKKDIQSNIKQIEPLFDVQECSMSTLHIGGISNIDYLSYKSASIGINKIGLSKNDVLALKDKTPISRLLGNELNAPINFAQTTAGSNIANNIAKAILNEKRNKTYVFVFSDMVENNTYFNMYKTNLKKVDIKESINNMIEPSLLQKIHELKDSNYKPKVILVLKQESKNLVDKRQVAEFWLAVFKTLNIDIQIVDDLSNHIDL